MDFLPPPVRGNVPGGAWMKLPDLFRSLLPKRPQGGPAAHGPAGESPGRRSPQVPGAGPACGQPGEPGSRPGMEIAEQVRIAALWKDHWRQYAVEEYRFRLRYGKSCRCDVCGEFKKELFPFRGKTCCALHMPAGCRPGQDAGLPGAGDDPAEKDP